MIYNNENKKNYTYYHSVLKQIILASMLSVVSFFIKNFSNKICPSLFKKFFFIDFLCYIPLLIIPLYSKKYFSFIIVSLSEGIAFWSRSSSYPYNPILSLFYGIIWGILPNFFLNKKNNSFFRVYFFINLIFIFHFVFYYIISIIWIKFYFFQNNFFDLKNNLFSYSRITYIKFYLLIKFFSLFIISLVNTYLYLRIKRQVLLIF
ncbi:MAG: hypothetical protein Q2306_02095 [Phytoplasma sp.]|uniref:hypothetical protein n=1 Tax=Phytoplasma sp. TaxID=2155 RepID=UPI002B413420|nr:hypothetical protein [Phytoplasma sp.]WRH06665.1 MAG: hypothetical protein Q2306_02095 [Phytoplasma sp.]